MVLPTRKKAAVLDTWDASASSLTQGLGCAYGSLGGSQVMSKESSPTTGFREAETVPRARFTPPWRFPPARSPWATRRRIRSAALEEPSSRSRGPSAEKITGCELAWTPARRWWGHGYATEGARATLDYAFTILKKDRVISPIHPENRASIRVAERLGQSLQGRMDHFGREMLCYGDRLGNLPVQAPDSTFSMFSRRIRGCRAAIRNRRSQDSRAAAGLAPSSEGCER